MNDLRKAAKKALRVLKTTWGIGSEDILKQWEETIEALRQALAEPEDPRIVELRTLIAEPTVTGVIFEVHRGPLSKSIREFGECPCPTHVEGDVRIEVKEEREWVGLTTAEVIRCQEAYYFDTYANIEAKLKEKNT
jgi:hypothetical protein